MKNFFSVKLWSWLIFITISLFLILNNTNQISNKQNNTSVNDSNLYNNNTINEHIIIEEKNTYSENNITLCITGKDENLTSASINKSPKENSNINITQSQNTSSNNKNNVSINENNSTVIQSGNSLSSENSNNISTNHKNSTSTATITENNISTEYDYVINNNTKKFHVPSCSSVKQIKETNRQNFTGTRDELINKGYSPCKRCNP